MMKMKIKEKIIFVVYLLNILVTFISIQFMDDKVALHFGANGTPDRWGSKYELLGISLLYLVLGAFFEVIIIIYRKKASGELDDKATVSAKNNLKIIEISGLLCALLCIAFQIIIIYLAFTVTPEFKNNDLNDYFFKIEAVILGVMLVLIGNYLPKTRINGLIGIRTKWSMANDKSWELCHRFGGRLMFACGILCVIAAIALKGSYALGVVLGLTIVYTIIVTIASYVFYKNNPD